MPSVSFNTLNDDQWRRWAEARRQLYRSILRNPGSSEYAVKQARHKLDSAHPDARPNKGSIVDGE